MPHISFLIPVFNMADTLPDTLESLIRIREFPFEVIVINDGSSDSIEEVIEIWAHRFKQIPNIEFQAINQENRGRAAALNEGARIAEGTYINFLDADDIIDPDEILKLWECATNGSFSYVIGQFKIVNASGDLVLNRPLDSDLDKEDLIFKLAYAALSPLTLNAFLIKREFFFKIDSFDTHNLKSEDKDLLIRLLKSDGKFRICNSFHYVYKKHNMSRKKILAKRIQWMKYRQQTINKNFSGVRLLLSKVLQFNYDLLKLMYEIVFKYRLR